MKYCGTMQHVALDVKAWADKTFPQRTDASMFLKLYGEVGELIDARDGLQDGEVADILIMVLDYAARKGINPDLAVQRKMYINEQRQWEVTPLGTFSHVK